MINRLTIKDKRFLLFFTPLFFMKLLNVSGQNKVFIVFSVMSFLFLAINIRNEKFSTRQFHNLMVLLLFSALLSVTCGKIGIFFSALMVLAMKRVDMDKIYTSLLKIGLVTLAIACYLNLDGRETTRYINGEWETMVKRDNILYVSYAAIVSLYLLVNRTSVSIKQIIGISIASYLMFLYSGSRTGLISIVILVFFLLILRINSLKERKLIELGCILTPTFCMIFSLFTAWGYGRYGFLYMLDMMQQGRIGLNNYYFNHYDFTLFGQHIVETANQNAVMYLNLDCAYMDMLLGEGLIFSIFWCVASAAVIKYFYRRNRIVEVAIMMMYAVYGIAETFLPNCFLNMSLFLYGEYFYYGLCPSRIYKKFETHQN